MVSSGSNSHGSFSLSKFLPSIFTNDEAGVRSLSVTQVMSIVPAGALLLVAVVSVDCVSLGFDVVVLEVLVVVLEVAAVVFVVCGLAVEADVTDEVDTVSGGAAVSVIDAEVSAVTVVSSVSEVGSVSGTAVVSSAAVVEDAAVLDKAAAVIVVSGKVNEETVLVSAAAVTRSIFSGSEGN